MACSGIALPLPMRMQNATKNSTTIPAHCLNCQMCLFTRVQTKFYNILIMSWVFFIRSVSGNRKLTRNLHFYKHGCSNFLFSNIDFCLPRNTSRFVAEPVETVPCEQDSVESRNSDPITNYKISELNEQTDSITVECSCSGGQNVNPTMHFNSETRSEMCKKLSDISNINNPSLQNKSVEIIQGADAQGTVAPTNEDPVLQCKHGSMECESGLTNTSDNNDCSDKNVCVLLGKLNNFKTDNASSCVSDGYTSSAIGTRRHFECPLCWKTFERNEAQMLHMKACALRHDVTTRQLLDAVELQERQAAERQALGLPDIPAAHAVKKPSRKVS
jgi:hypothetical protein